MYTDLHVKYLLFLPDFNEAWIFSTYFRKFQNVKFHENPYSGRHLTPCGHTDRYRDSHDEADSRFENFRMRLKTDTIRAGD